jgi:hypothetical protein
MGQIRVTAASAAAMLTAFLAQIDADASAAYMNVYTAGDGIPAGPHVAITTQTLLGTLTFNQPAGTVTDNSLALDVATDEDAALASDTIAFVRVFDGDDNAVFDGTAGLEGSGEAFEFQTLDCSENLPIEFVSGTITISTGA